MLLNFQMKIISNYDFELEENKTGVALREKSVWFVCYLVQAEETSISFLALGKTLRNSEIFVMASSF